MITTEQLLKVIEECTQERPSGQSVVFASKFVEALARELQANREEQPVGYIDPDSLKEYRGQRAGGTWSAVKRTTSGLNMTVPIYLTAPRAASGGWIDCSERMPEDGDVVLVCQEGGIIYCAEMEGGVLYPDEFPRVPPEGREITHWMPLPAAPEVNT